jgi:integrase/recombinase XerD
MSTTGFWPQAVEDYLAYRRRLGVELKIEGQRLRRFARFAEQSGACDCLTLALAEAWALDTPRANPLTWARRIEVLRGFAQFLRRQDPAAEVPPPGLFGPAHRRLTPHAFTEEELVGLLEAARLLPPKEGLRPATCRAVLGLLASAGLRIGEAVRLTRQDVDLDAGVLNIRESKGHRSRLVPLHGTALAELQDYARQRDRCAPLPKGDGFFLLDGGKPVNARQVLYAFHAILQALGWSPRGDYARHRPHDLRHTFIVRSLLANQRQGVDPGHSALALSAYVGHTRFTDTYWHVTGIPELMAAAVSRFHEYAMGARP